MSQETDGRGGGEWEFHISLDQEWVEALSFYHFLVTGTVVTYSQVNSVEE